MSNCFSVTQVTVRKMKFSIKDFFSKCDEIHSFLRIGSRLLRKSLRENVIFCAVSDESYAFTFVPWNFALSHFRSSHLQMFFKIDDLKHFAIISENHLCWSPFLIKLQAFRPATLLKRDSNTGVFLWILQKF